VSTLCIDCEQCPAEAGRKVCRHCRALRYDGREYQRRMAAPAIPRPPQRGRPGMPAHPWNGAQPGSPEASAAIAMTRRITGATKERWAG
jgi:hypothetical protein